MDDFQMRSLLLKWNFLNQLVKDQVYHLENICLDCRSFLKSIRKPPMEHNDINTFIEPIKDNKDLLNENCYKELKIVDEILNKAEKIRTNVYLKPLIPKDDLNEDPSNLMINDFNINIGSCILNNRLDEKNFAKEIFPLNISSAKSCTKTNTKILVINNDIAKQYKKCAINKENKTKTNKSINENINRITFTTTAAKIPSKIMSEKSRTKISLIKPLTSKDKINKITESINKIVNISEKKDLVLSNDINNRSTNEKFVSNFDDLHLNNSNNINEFNLVDNYACKNKIDNDYNIMKSNTIFKNDEMPNDNIVINEANKMYNESNNNDKNTRMRLKEIKLLNKKLLHNEDLRNKIESNFHSSNNFASLLEQKNDNILESMNDAEAYSYKRCQFFSICKLAISDYTRGSDLKEFVIFSRQLINKISSDIAKIEHHKIEHHKLEDNYCKNDLDNILDKLFIYSDNKKKSLKYSNIKQIKEYLNNLEKISTLKLKLIMLNTVDNYILQMLNKINTNQSLYLKCYSAAYSLVCSFGRSSPTILQDLQENHLDEEMDQRT